MNLLKITEHAQQIRLSLSSTYPEYSQFSVFKSKYVCFDQQEAFGKPLDKLEIKYAFAVFHPKLGELKLRRIFAPKWKCRIFLHNHSWTQRKDSTSWQSYELKNTRKEEKSYKYSFPFGWNTLISICKGGKTPRIVKAININYIEVYLNKMIIRTPMMWALMDMRLFP